LSLFICIRKANDITQANSHEIRSHSNFQQKAKGKENTIIVYAICQNFITCSKVYLNLRDLLQIFL